jgi:NADPH:quinone reductase-like Zn-dependent oxidoreductase
VLIRISAGGVNPIDTKIRAGKAAHAKQPLPAVLGGFGVWPLLAGGCGVHVQAVHELKRFPKSI